MVVDNVIRCDCCTHRLARYTDRNILCAPVSQLSMFKIRTFLLPMLAAVVLGAVGASPAMASHTQAMFFEAPRDLVDVTSAARAKALAQLQSLGVKALRVE